MSEAAWPSTELQAPAHDDVTSLIDTVIAEVQDCGRLSARCVRLFAAALARNSDVCKDPRARGLVAVGELRADAPERPDQETMKRLARSADSLVRWEYAGPRWVAYRCAMSHMSNTDGPAQILDNVMWNWLYGEYVTAGPQVAEARRKVRLAQLRHAVNNVLCPKPLWPLPREARPLADLLEDGGCAEGAANLRSLPAYRGWWALDAILGKGDP